MMSSTWMCGDQERPKRSNDTVMPWSHKTDIAKAGSEYLYLWYCQVQYVELSAAPVKPISDLTTRSRDVGAQ